MAVFAASRSVDVTGASVAMTAALAISTAAALGVFARLQVVHINFFLVFTHIAFLQLVFWFWGVSRKTARRLEPAVRRHAQLLLVVFAASRGVEATRALAAVASALPAAAAATLSVFARLQVAHFDFFFLLFAHITFLQSFSWFWVVSIAPNSCCPPTTFSLGSRSSKRTSLSFNASPVELHAPRESAPLFFFDELTANL
jgi:hypothetical protein